MSELTQRQVTIRAIIAALDVEQPNPPFDELFVTHPENVLANNDGVPVMSISRIVDVVLDALQGPEPLYRRTRADAPEPDYSGWICVYRPDTTLEDEVICDNCLENQHE